MRRIPCLAAAAVLLVMPAPADAPPAVKDVSRLIEKERTSTRPARSPDVAFVDCAAGESINRALSSPARDLVVEIDGICEENVVIQRDNVTLRGDDPWTDGIKGVAVNPTPAAALALWNAHGVVLENLQVVDSGYMGVAAYFSDLEIANCRFDGNAMNGLQLSGSSYATGCDVVFSDNYGGGVRAQQGAAFVCNHGCLFEDNVDWAVQVDRASFVHLVGAIVSGDLGVLASLGGFLQMNGGMIVAYERSVAAWDGYILLSDVWAAGPFEARDQGKLEFRGVHHRATGPSRIDTGSMLTALDGFHPFDPNPIITELCGDIDVGTFASVMLLGGTMLDGNLTCSAAGDAYADDPRNVSGTVQGCDHCAR